MDKKFNNNIVSSGHPDKEDDEYDYIGINDENKIDSGNIKN